MKLRLKIISKNLFKLDQINYMHIRHKCSSSTTIHSHTGNFRLNQREIRLLEINDSPIIRFIDILSHQKCGLIETQSIFFSWNETLTYSEKFGQMTYLSQTLLISDITVDYAEYDESMQFRMISNMFPSGEYECPR